MKKKAPFRSPEVCPVCGEDVPPKSLACPECGADERSGWREDALAYDGVDLPDEEFDYDEFVKREFEGKDAAGRPKSLWWIVGIVLFIVMLWGLLIG